MPTHCTQSHRIMASVNPERVDFNEQNGGHGCGAAGADILNGSSESTSTPAVGRHSSGTVATSDASPLVEAELANVGSEDLSLILRVQALLTQFSHPQVRADFVNSKFNWTINPNLLERLDDVRCYLFPRWTTGSLEIQPPHRSFEAASHLFRLIRKDTSLCILPGEDPLHSLSYKNWFNLLETIATDKYWDTIAVEARCTHTLQESDMSSESAVASMTHPKKMGTIKPKKEIRDRSSLSVSSSSDSGSSGGSSEQDSRTAITSSRRGRRQGHDRRDVVTPPPF